MIFRFGGIIKFFKHAKAKPLSHHWQRKSSFNLGKKTLRVQANLGRHA